jgi:hypothetical protein
LLGGTWRCKPQKCQSRPKKSLQFFQILHHIFAPKTTNMTEGLLKEKWTQWVALTTTIIAVCAALSTLKGGSNSTKTQLLTTQETNKWSYFQSKSIKQHICEEQKMMLEIEKSKNPSPETLELIDKNIERTNQDIARYDKEKGEIKAEAEALNISGVDFKNHAGSFHIATMFLQICIMLSSVGVLIKRPVLWYVGIVLGVIGILYMINGFLAWF